MLRETKLENRNHLVYQNRDEKKYLKNYPKRKIQKRGKNGGFFFLVSPHPKSNWGKKIH